MSRIDPATVERLRDACEQLELGHTRWGMRFPDSGFGRRSRRAAVWAIYRGLDRDGVYDAMATAVFGRGWRAGVGPGAISWFDANIRLIDFLRDRGEFIPPIRAIAA